MKKWGFAIGAIAVVLAILAITAPARADYYPPGWSIFCARFGVPWLNAGVQGPLTCEPLNAEVDFVWGTKTGLSPHAHPEGLGGFYPCSRHEGGFYDDNAWKWRGDNITEIWDIAVYFIGQALNGNTCFLSFHGRGTPGIKLYGGWGGGDGASWLASYGTNEIWNIVPLPPDTYDVFQLMARAYVVGLGVNELQLDDFDVCSTQETGIYGTVYIGGSVVIKNGPLARIQLFSYLLNSGYASAGATLTFAFCYTTGSGMTVVNFQPEHNYDIPPRSQFTGCFYSTLVSASGLPPNTTIHVFAVVQNDAGEIQQATQAGAFFIKSPDSDSSDEYELGNFGESELGNLGEPELGSFDWDWYE